jgi:hypothetical protein
MVTTQHAMLWWQPRPWNGTCHLTECHSGTVYATINATRAPRYHHQHPDAPINSCYYRAYQHPLLTQKSYRRLLHLTSYAFGTYKHQGKRASAREGNHDGSGGQTKSDPARRYDHILECMVTPTVQNVTSAATQLCFWCIYSPE